MAMEIESQLQNLGYQIKSIVDAGEKAIAKGEMDGLEAVEEIRNRFSIPEIFSTAYLDEGRIERAKIFDLLPEKSKDIQKKNIELVLKTGKKQRYEIEYQTSEDQYKTFECNIGPVIVEEKIIGFILVSRDITDQ
ncbi:MAG: hypothetical protein HOD92_09250 [Deltaproteobacteria bacterium]|jgi:hypothetical protein|nr:hypothetical protein [Deltaproteobacteria bacterium]